jgi:uncharacterized protein YndB with AHSA1/START domain
MQRIEVERTIAAPIQRVWDVYTDHASWSRWAGVGKSWLETKGSPDPNGVSESCELDDIELFMS